MARKVMGDRALLKVGLPKWPAIVVVGEPVAIDEAAEIIVRTDGFLFSTNDHEFATQLYAAIGVHSDGLSPSDWDAFRAVKEEYRVLPLDYLTTARIASAYIGGPHGWIDWKGNVFTSTTNIGKYPWVLEVLNEWGRIAEAFPFLSLRCQLYNAESGESGGEPVVEFAVEEGRVELRAPQPMQARPDRTEQELLGGIVGLFTDPYRERGCTIAQFKQALEITKERIREREANAR
jgi:hypothetical protein